MNVVVIGLGSMGRRRIRLIKRYDSTIKIYGIDTNTLRRQEVEAEYEILTDESLGRVLLANKIDCAFICTSPLTHSSLIDECLKNNLNVFTELNLVADGYSENIKLAKDKNKILFLSSTFLYRAEIKEIKNFVEIQQKSLNYTYHVGQYLPDWHPWESYSNFFVGDKKTNGCREIFAIELPWIIETFGEIENFNVSKGKISNLNIGYNDSYLVLIEHKSGHKGMLAVDVVSRKPVRNLEIYGEDLYLSWDGSGEGLKQFNIETKRDEEIKLYDVVEQLDEYSRFVVENAYFDEITDFFVTIMRGSKPRYSFEKDRVILQLIDEIEA